MTTHDTHLGRRVHTNQRPITTTTSTRTSVAVITLSASRDSSKPPVRSASIRKRTFKDGSNTTYAVLFNLNGKQTSVPFATQPDAKAFQNLVNNVGPRRAMEIENIPLPTKTGQTPRRAHRRTMAHPLRRPPHRPRTKNHRRLPPLHPTRHRTLPRRHPVGEADGRGCRELGEAHGDHPEREDRAPAGAEDVEEPARLPVRRSGRRRPASYPREPRRGPPITAGIGRRCGGSGPPAVT
jgi:hypothetical protein